MGELEKTSKEYKNLLAALKATITDAQSRAVQAVNQELIVMYWKIAKEIIKRQEEQGWGGKTTEILARDLQKAFPDMKGFSKPNLEKMRAFAHIYPDEAILSAVLIKLSWTHNHLLISKVSDPEIRLWYANMVVREGWSYRVLEAQIESGAFERHGKALTNFKEVLPATNAEATQQLFKDPYVLEFIEGLPTDLKERHLEKGLIDKIGEFLLELGHGFAFVGSQYPLRVGGKDFRIDLLFFHLQLRCYVMVDLKIDEFTPEYAGKMGFYLKAVENDERLKHPDNTPALGLVLCKGKDTTVVEYALSSSDQPIAVADWSQAKGLSPELRAVLPSVSEIESGLEEILDETF